MKLELGNLNEIHNMLTVSFDSAMLVLKNIDSNADIAPTSENRQLVNNILDQTSDYLLEVSHVSSFLQQCEMQEVPLIPQKQKLFMECKDLCAQIQDSTNQIMKWVMQANKYLNEQKCPVADDIPLNDILIRSSDKIVMSEDLLKAYQQVRDVLKDMHKEAMFLDLKNMINTAGRRLEVAQGNQLFIETEHEMNMLCDYGLFQYRKDGKNIVERYYDLNHELYTGQKLAILLAYKQSRFSFLEIIKPVHEHGLIVYDHLIEKSFLMVDKGLYQLAKKHSGYALLTHYVQMPNFILTTGASTPVLLESAAGKKMWQLFKRLIDHHQDLCKLETPAYFQCIADLFKMAIHEDVAKKVASRGLPMNYSNLPS